MNTITRNSQAIDYSRSVRLASFGIENLSFAQLFNGQLVERTRTLIDKVQTRHGQISTVAMLSEAKLKKGHPFGNVMKFSVFQVRFGVAYENKKAVIDGRADGSLPSVPQSPKGKTWIQFPYWMRSDKTNEILVACSSVLNGNRSTSYLDSGWNDIPMESAKPFLYASSGNRPLWFTIGLSGILWIA